MPVFGEIVQKRLWQQCSRIAGVYKGWGICEKYIGGELLCQVY